ncbi:ribonuclease h1 [Plakobranchus ocellatus]|uniref:Ribonuclease h1 n=1 Tax=Plakobranchus ocellatus TaxID=259542 RepID=A0AAV4DB08_9GAST|nr:ribonuclease h1 [Plakobranchus ocellatus]
MISSDLFGRLICRVSVEVYNDSLSALQAIQRKHFKVKDIRRLFNLIRKFPPYVHISFVWIPAHVGIQGNENVDKLAKAALNTALYSGKLICWSDLKPKVNAHIHTFGKKIGILRGQTSSMKYSPTWEKTSIKEVKELA